MTDFNEWWEAEEVFMRADGTDNETILGAMRNIAATAWDSAIDAALAPLEEKIKKTAKSITKAESAFDEDAAIYLRSMAWTLEGLVEDIRELKSE